MGLVLIAYPISYRELRYVLLCADCSRSNVIGADTDHPISVAGWVGSTSACDVCKREGIVHAPPVGKEVK